MVRLVGQDSVPARRAGAEPRGGGRVVVAHAGVRAHLLFGDLSFRHHARPHLVAARQDEEEPLQLFRRETLAALWRVGRVCRSLGGWCRFAGSLVGTVQQLRPHRHQPAEAHLRIGQQRAGLDSRALRELRLLSRRRMDSLHAHVHHRCRDLRHCGRSGMAWRQDLLQHHLPRGHGAQLLCTLLVAEDSLRCRQV